MTKWTKKSDTELQTIIIKKKMAEQDVETVKTVTKEQILAWKKEVEEMLSLF